MKRCSVTCSECRRARQFTGETEWHIIAAIQASGWTATGRFALCPECIKAAKAKQSHSYPRKGITL